MEKLWRGSWRVKARIISGLILLVYVTAHFLNIGLAVISSELADTAQDLRLLVTRSILGTVLLYGALAVHAVLALARVAFSVRLKLTPVDLVQFGFGAMTPLLLCTHVVHTRASHELFATNDSITYIAALIWETSDGWIQALLLLMTWTHGCLGLHMWLRVSARWRKWFPLFTAFAALVPAFALAGFMAEGRYGKALMRGDSPETFAFFADANFPNAQAFGALKTYADLTWWAIFAVLSVTVLIYAGRRVLRARGGIDISYVDGPTIRAKPGDTLLDISRASDVPHMSLCGGRGRCTTCRVIVEDSAGELPPPSEAEQKALRAVKAQYGARLACQLRPCHSMRVYKVFQTDGTQQRDHASQGKEAELAVLFLDMRGFTARTAGQLPYDVVFLLNRFFDAVVPAIQAEGGTVDKYMGDGLLAVFETEDAASSARAALRAAAGIETALFAFNVTLAEEDAPPLEIGLGLHLGGLVIGDIGAKGQSARTLIGDSVNAASRLEAKSKDLGARILISEPLLAAAGCMVAPEQLQELSLRGVAQPLKALPVPYSKRLTQVLPA